MQPILNIKDGLWGNLATIVFMLALAVLAVGLDYHSHGAVSIFVWAFVCAFVLFCLIPINSIRKPKTRLLAFDGFHLLWRIYNGKTKEVILETRLPLDSIRALKWIIPTPPGCRRGQDYTRARLLFITAERSSHTLPDEFFPAAYRSKIEGALKQRFPDIQIVEKFESPA